MSGNGPSARARILVVTNGHLARNPRVYKEARTLGAAGYDVTVLGVRNHPASLAVDAALQRGAPFRSCAVDMLPGGEAGAAQVLARRLALLVARRLASAGRPTIHALGPARALLRRARACAADLVIVHNEIAHWAGAQLLRAGRGVAADIEDWHSEDLLPAARAHRPIAQLRELERTLLHECVHTTTTSEAMAAALHARHGGRKPAVLTNSFPLESEPRRGAPGEPPAFVWFSQTLGPGRGLEEFLAAWSAMREPSRVLLVGEAQPDYAARLLETVPAPRRERLAWRGLVPPDALSALLVEQDVGLALEPSSPANKDLTISNKILQYLNAGLAVVATPTAGQREVLARVPGAGLLLPADTGAAAEALDALLRDRAALERRQRAARRGAEEYYCWEREAPRLLALVASALQAAPARC